MERIREPRSGHYPRSVSIGGVEKQDIFRVPRNESVGRYFYERPNLAYWGRKLMFDFINAKDRM